MLVRFSILLCMSIVSLSCSQVPITKEVATGKEEPATYLTEWMKTEAFHRFQVRECEKEKFGADLSSITEEIASSNSIRLFEGLPHQLWEMELLEKELKEKKTVKLHNFPFYATPIPISHEVAKKLRSACSNTEHFKPYGGPKFCGGYHPDWCIEFKNGDKVIQVQVCFGCHEAAFDGEDRVMTDTNDSGLEELAEILKPLRKNRPKKEKPQEEEKATKVTTTSKPETSREAESFASAFEAESKKFEKDINTLMGQLTAIKTFTLYEGLPHQSSEKDLLKKELKEKQTIRLHKYPFYKETVPVSKELNQRLRHLCLDSTNYEQITLLNMKMCCEFHPDWCLEFTEGDNVYHIQLCFGCKEAQICSAKDVLYTNVAESVAKELTELLKPLRKNRPAKETQSKVEE